MYRRYCQSHPCLDPVPEWDGGRSSCFRSPQPWSRPFHAASTATSSRRYRNNDVNRIKVKINRKVLLKRDFGTYNKRYCIIMKKGVNKRVTE